MTAFDKRNASEKLARLNLTPANAAFVDYWLSMLSPEGRPRASNIGRLAAGRARQSAMTTEVRPGRSVVCRAVGNTIAAAFDTDLLGADLVEILPAPERPVRIERMADVALGAIARNFRRIIMSCGHEALAEEIALPFGDFSPQVARQIMTHFDLTGIAAARGRMTPRVIRPAETVENVDLGFSDRTVWV